MVHITATAVLIAASVLAPPIAGTFDADGPHAIVIQVEVPEHSAAPLPPTGTPVTPDADHPRSGTLPATGGEVALWGGALALAALAVGAGLAQAHRRRSG